MGVVYVCVWCGVLCLVYAMHVLLVVCFAYGYDMCACLFYLSVCMYVVCSVLHGVCSVQCIYL